MLRGRLELDVGRLRRVGCTEEGFLAKLFGCLLLHLLVVFGEEALQCWE